MLGTEVREIEVTDMAVHPKSRNAYLSVMRGQGADAKPVLMRVDGAGRARGSRAREGNDFAKVALPNPPAPRRPPTQSAEESITDLAFVDGR